MNGNEEFRPEQDMRDKLVPVTGASSGIGKETARQFARLGAIVLVLARSRKRLEEMANEIRLMGGRAEEFVLDLADLDALIETVEKIKVKFGVPDVIVNNAGAGKWRFLEEMEYGEAHDMMTVPYMAALHLTKASSHSTLTSPRQLRPGSPLPDQYSRQEGPGRTRQPEDHTLLFQQAHAPGYGRFLESPP